MVTLKTVETRQEAKAFFDKEGLTFNGNSDCLCAKDKQEVLGYCLFDIDDKKMTIRAIEPQKDLMLLDGVLRSTLHIAASRNIHQATWADKAPQKIFKVLGFVTEENTLNISHLYEHKCCGCKKEG